MCFWQENKKKSNEIKQMRNKQEFVYMSVKNRHSLATSFIETESRNAQVNSRNKYGGDGKRRSLTLCPFPTPWPCCPPAIETPPRPVPTGPLISWPENSSCCRILPRQPRLSSTAIVSDDMLSAAIPPLHCACILQPATPFHVVALKSWTISALICFNREPL